jgi:hypothetical protein
MKKLLATTAIATMAFTGAASAQSLLERVLSDISAVPTTNVTGIFANTADNIAIPGVPQNVATIGGTTTTVDRTVAPGDLLTVTLGGTEMVAEVGPNGELYVPGTTTRIDSGVRNEASVALGATLLQNSTGELTVDPSALSGTSDGVTSNITSSTTGFEIATTTVNEGGDTFSTGVINASINNMLRGLSGPTAETVAGAQAT